MHSELCKSLVFKFIHDLTCSERYVIVFKNQIQMNSLTAEILFLEGSLGQLESVSPKKLVHIFLETKNKKFQKYIAKKIMEKKTREIDSEYKGCLLKFLLRIETGDPKAVSGDIINFFSDPFVTEEFKQSFYRANVGYTFLRITVDIKSVLNLEEELSLPEEKESTDLLIEDKKIPLLKRVKVAQKNKIENLVLREELHEYLVSLSLYEIAQLIAGSHWQNSLIFDFWDEWWGYDSGRKLSSLYEGKNQDPILELLLERAGIMPPDFQMGIESVSPLKKWIFWLENPSCKFAVSQALKDPGISQDAKIRIYYSLEWHECPNYLVLLLRNISMENSLILYNDRRMQFYGQYQEEVFGLMRRRLKNPEDFGIKNEKNIAEWFKSLKEGEKIRIFSDKKVETKRLLIGCD